MQHLSKELEISINLRRFLAELVYYFQTEGAQFRRKQQVSEVGQRKPLFHFKVCFLMNNEKIPLKLSKCLYATGCL